MSAKEPTLIVCSVPNIHKPKPRRINKKSNYYLYNNKHNINNNRPFNQRTKNNNVELKKHKKHNIYEEKKKYSFNLDLIPLEEIENDFKELKSKFEEIEEQKELIQLIYKTESELLKNENNLNAKRIKRSKKPFCINVQ